MATKLLAGNYLMNYGLVNEVVYLFWSMNVFSNLPQVYIESVQIHQIKLYLNSELQK